MKIPEIQTLQMNRTNAAHNGVAKLSDIAGAPLNSIPNAASDSVEKTRKSFDSYLLEAFSSMNAQQVNVSNMQQQVITDPDSLDLHDVTIAMSKARASLNLAQSVIDRLVQGWSEITTTR
ncbi:MAG: flagellar hook-basal body complex protein FliE [Treponema sp.]|nr:flagellar hook-basal body complex protein FliE [Treponema sp.]